MDKLDTHRLVRLKRYECTASHPVDVENFIAEFQCRQRKELLEPSFFQVFKEGLRHLITEFQVPTMAYVTATAIALFLSILILRDGSFNTGMTRGNTSMLYNTSFDRNQIPYSIDKIEPVSLRVDNIRNQSNSMLPPTYFLQNTPTSKVSILKF